MNKGLARLSSTLLSTAATLCVLALPVLQADAQNPALQEKVQEIKAASAANKAALAQFTWQEQQTISLNGDVKSTKTFQVSIGPDGKQVKTETGASAAPAPSGGRMKERIIDKKKKELEDYGQQISALAKQYATPDPVALQQAFQQGNISLQPDAGDGTVNLVIKNYVKSGDQVTMVFNRAQKAMQAVNVSTYLSAPSDAVTIAVQYAKLPSGVNHVSTTNVNGVSKGLGVVTQNSNYQHI
jgi:hypothetical protein